MDAGPLLQVDDLRTHFFTHRGVVRAVDGISFQVAADETVALVGESGCGKSITALSLLRLVPEPPGRIVGGRILLGGRDLLALDEPAMRRVRGREIAMIFQEPMTSLNPVFTVGDQIVEALRVHTGLSARAAWRRGAEMLELVRLPDAQAQMRSYPHRLSGGMRQRVMIAMALACRPGLLIADEPTTALDVTIQAQILDLLQRLQQELGMAIVLITHDLGVVAEMADRVLVMYAGRVVEQAPTAELLERPHHPYTRGLVRSTAGLGGGRGRRLPEIPGMVPSPLDMPPGCPFAPRCDLAEPACSAAMPALVAAGPGRTVACHVAERELKAHGAAVGP